MKELTNKQLQDLLVQYPDDMPVYLDRNGSIHTACSYVEKRLLHPVNRDCIVLRSEVPLV